MIYSNLLTLVAELGMAAALLLALKEVQARTAQASEPVRIPVRVDRDR